MPATPHPDADRKPASPPGEALERRHFRPANDDYGSFASRIVSLWPVLAAGAIVGCCLLIALAG